MLGRDISEIIENECDILEGASEGKKLGDVCGMVPYNQNDSSTELSHSAV